MNKEDVLLKEYETLRNESLSAVNNRNQVASFGLASLGALFAGTFIVDNPSHIPFKIIILNFGIPFVSIFVLYIWLGEVERMMRAGYYLVGLEKRINELFVDNVLNWENWLRSSKNQIKYSYYAIIGLFLGIAILSPVVGKIAAELPFKQYWWSLIVPWVVCFFIFFHVFNRTRKYKNDCLWK